MRKLHFLTVACCVSTLLLTGCTTSKQAGNLNGHPLDGNWIGVGNAVGYDDDYSIENTSLTIGEDGRFSFDDFDQTTDDMSGALFVNSDDEIRMECYDNPSNLTLPFGWENLEKNDKINYRLLSDEQLVLTYDNISYCFHLDNNKYEVTDSALYSLGENNVWYSNDGSSSSKNTYEFDLYDRYAELYSISPSKNKALVTNFHYIKNEGNYFTFFTNINKEKVLPDILSSLPNDQSIVTLKLECRDDSLAMTYKNQSLVFHNNVIYGLKTDGDSYRLCDSYFTIIDQLDEFFCHFAMNKEKNALYLYISDCIDGQEGENMVCGELVIDEKKGEWIWYLDKESSMETAPKDSAVYQKLSKISNTKIQYELDGFILRLNIGDKKYDLPLYDYPNTED